MSNDNKALADVQPGGRVRLGDQRSDLVPGIVRCAKCAFQLHRTNLYLQSGTVGAADSKTEPCPNGCGPLCPVTWETWAREGWAEAERLHLENAALFAQPSPGGQGDALDLVMGECEQWFDTTDVDLTAAAESIIAAIAARQPVGRSFQADVSEWMGQCFLPSLYSNMTERGDRLLEEVLELLQAHGYDKARVPTLVDYVFGRPVGDPAQEVGGVMVTLAGYCWVAGLDMHAAGDAELARISQPDVMAKIRAKQEAKNALHFDTPLPGNAARQPVGEPVGYACTNCDRTDEVVICQTCAGMAWDNGRLHEFHEVRELSTSLGEGVLDHLLPDEWHEKPLLRFQGAFDEGDRSVGIGERCGNVLAADQSGTVLGDYLAARAAKEGGQ